MELTQAQIAELFRFTEKKFVHWYDLQVELVDHLASSIEEEWAKDPALPFEAALDRVYKRFGIFGFAKVVQEKSERLHKAARRMWWSEIRAFFSWPKITFVFALCAACWQLTQWVPMAWLMIGLVVAYLAAGISNLYFYRRRTTPKKKLLLLGVSPAHFSGTAFVYQSVLFGWHDNYAPVLFCLLALFGILFETASYRVYQKVRSQAEQQYPEAFVVVS
ncbi:hypothetical protein [Flaviaesturariibacter amylovorans]|uniref:Uncharacterized protein n=1 Tax=Flaviaesturariibacter amylovorans TaxID=1084520 RepID=A0ABP8HST5_9BACT